MRLWAVWATSAETTCRRLKIFDRHFGKQREERAIGEGAWALVPAFGRVAGWFVGRRPVPLTRLWVFAAGFQWSLQIVTEDFVAVTIASQVEGCFAHLQWAK